MLAVPKMRYGTGAFVSRSLSMSKCGNIQGDWLCRTECCSLRLVKAFRINEHTRNVPYAVRSVLRNESHSPISFPACYSLFALPVSSCGV